jgi:hypothetical protein
MTIEELESLRKEKNAEFLQTSCKKKHRYNTLFFELQQLTKRINQEKKNLKIA